MAYFDDFDDFGVPGPDRQSLPDLIEGIFPGAGSDIFDNDSSGYLGYSEPNDPWGPYLREKSEGYRYHDYMEYYSMAYRPYMELAPQYPAMVEEVKTICQDFCNNGYDNLIKHNERLFGHLVNIINKYQKIADAGVSASGDDEPTIATPTKSK